MKTHTIAELHDAYDQGTLTVPQVVEDCLSRIEKSSLNAFITVARESAVKEASAAQAELKRLGKVPREAFPLFGVPVGIKDNFVTEGLRTTCASKILENYVPSYTATPVMRMKKAGGIVLGKLNMDEFGMGGSNENSAYGPVKHPTHSERVPGGSSGGAAAAVKAGLVMAALGSDTGGSIRLPASFCGVVGLKPTYGRVSRYGLIAFASSLDQAGPFTRSVKDAATLLKLISGPDEPHEQDSTCKRGAPAISTQPKDHWKTLKVGVPAEFLSAGVDPAVKAAIEAKVAWLKSEGVEVKTVTLPHLEYAVSVYYVVAVSEASSNLSRYDGIRYGVRPAGSDEATDLAGYYQKVRTLFGPEVKRRILLGTFTLSSGYADAYYQRACQVRRLIAQDFDRAFEQVDLILGPVSPNTAYKMGEKTQDPLTMYLNDIFTIPANLAGLPALSVPVGEDGQGLPIGLQLVGKAFCESDLLAMGEVLS